MERKIIFGGIFALIVISGYLFFRNNQKINHVPPTNETIIIFGGSLAKGTGATAGNDLAALLSKRFGKSVLNFGAGGDTTRDSISRISSAVEQNPELVIIVLGGNDLLQKIPEEKTLENMEKIITTFQENGATVIWASVLGKSDIESRGEAYAALAEKTGVSYVPDVLQGISDNPELMADTIHPNDAGYAMMEERLAPIIENIYNRKDDIEKRK